MTSKSKQQTSTSNTIDKHKVKKGVSKYFKLISNSQEDPIDLDCDSEDTVKVVKTINQKKRKRKRLILSDEEDDDDDDFQLDTKVEKMTPKVTRAKSKRVRENRTGKDECDGTDETKDGIGNVDNENKGNEEDQAGSKCESEDEKDATYKPEVESGSESDVDIFMEESNPNEQGDNKSASPTKEILCADESVKNGSDIEKKHSSISESKDEKPKPFLLKSTASVSKKKPQGKGQISTPKNSKQSSLMSSFSKQQSLLVNGSSGLDSKDKKEPTHRPGNYSGDESDGDILIDESHKSENDKNKNEPSKEKIVKGNGSRGKSPEIEMISSTAKTEPKEEKPKPFVLKASASTTKSTKKSILGGGKTSGGKKSKQSSLMSSFAKQQSLLDAEKKKGRTCPVCAKEFPPSAWNSEINDHIDNCLIE